MVPPRQTEEQCLPRLSQALSKQILYTCPLAGHKHLYLHEEQVHPSAGGHSARICSAPCDFFFSHWQQELTLTSFAALFFHPLGGLESHTTALRQNVVRTCEEHLQRRNAHDTPTSDGDSCAVLCLFFVFFFLPDFYSLMYALPHHDDMP